MIFSPCFCAKQMSFCLFIRMEFWGNEIYELCSQFFSHLDLCIWKLVWMVIIVYIVMTPLHSSALFWWLTAFDNKWINEALQDSRRGSASVGENELEMERMTAREREVGRLRLNGGRIMVILPHSPLSRTVLMASLTLLLSSGPQRTMSHPSLSYHNKSS